MNNTDTPNFAAWNNANLANFAKDSYLQLKKQDEAIQQLRLDLKDAMKVVRQLHSELASRADINKRAQ